MKQRLAKTHEAESVGDAVEKVGEAAESVHGLIQGAARNRGRGHIAVVAVSRPNETDGVRFPAPEHRLSCELSDYRWRVFKKRLGSTY